MRPTLSLEAPVGDTDEGMLGDILIDDAAEAVERQAQNRLLRAEMAQSLTEMLTPREREVLALRYGLDGCASSTLEEVGATLGLTRERAPNRDQSAQQATPPRAARPIHCVTTSIERWRLPLADKYPLAGRPSTSSRGGRRARQGWGGRILARRIGALEVAA